VDCAGTTIGFDERHLLELRKRIIDQHVPVSGSVELTHRCNLRCVHCYLGPQSACREKRSEELGAERWLSLVDEITDAGCLFLLVTGGEPLLREDFANIYRRAKQNGLLVIIFTNGTLITEDVAKLFADLPPHCVEISLYGSTAATYEKITGTPGSFDRCIQGIERLLHHKVSVGLKTMLMTLNADELCAMKVIAQEYGVKFRFDPVINPCLNGDRSPLKLRLSPEEVVEKEFKDPARLRDWSRYLERCSSVGSRGDELYSCGAGLYNFHVDPYGNLQPCLMATTCAYNLSQNSFLDGWRGVVPDVRDLKMASDLACRQCDRFDICGFCPPAFELENSDTSCQKPSEFHCALSNFRLKKIQGGGN